MNFFKRLFCSHILVPTSEKYIGPVQDHSDGGGEIFDFYIVYYTCAKCGKVEVKSQWRFPQ